MFKKIFSLLLASLLLVSVFACGKSTSIENSTVEPKDLFNLEENIKNKKVVVAYFSINDDVKEVAEKFKEALDADILEIVPEIPYSEEDLDFTNQNSRVSIESRFNPLDKFIDIDDEEFETSEGIILEPKKKADEVKRITELPKIKKNSANSYPIVVVGFPVWDENAPKPVYTFMQELKDMVVVPFCTGGKMGMIDQYLSNMTEDGVRVMSGKEFDKNVSIEEIRDWVAMLSADF